MGVGFIGLGLMGFPMALNLARRYQLTVWNRTHDAAKIALLRQTGATAARSAAEVIKESDITFTMLINSRAVLLLLASPDCQRVLRGKTLVNTTTMTVGESLHAADVVQQAGGFFIEMPVSGSKVLAEQGQLVGLLAGKKENTDRIEPFLESMAKATVYCGPFGAALRMKYVINLYLFTMTVGLAEAVNLAMHLGLDPNAVSQAIDAGPLTSAYSRVKLRKLVEQDWEAQGSIKNGYFENLRIVVEVARAAGVSTPLADVCSELFLEANRAGLGEEDLVAVAKVIAQRE